MKPIFEGLRDFVAGVVLGAIGGFFLLSIGYLIGKGIQLVLGL